MKHRFAKIIVTFITFAQLALIQGLHIPLVGAAPPLKNPSTVTKLSGTDTTQNKRKWVEHLVLPAQRMKEITERYKVTATEIAEWNGLDVQRPRLISGKKLRIYANRVPKQITYIVRFGDNWRSIARRYGIEQTKLRRWNSQVPRRFEAGQQLTIWVEEDFVPYPLFRGWEIDADPSGLPLKEVSKGGFSIGQPTSGRLISGVQVPHNPELYTIRRPEFSWGSTHSVYYLQLAIAKFRKRSGFTGELVISDMSREKGGAFGTHHSHRSGRDVDIWLPLKPGLSDDATARRIADVDFEATFQMIKALIRTGQVQYIFIAKSRQKYIYQIARKAGMSVADLGEVMQYPRRAQTAIVRHSKGHTKHVHVRFRCAPHEKRCR